MAEKKIILGDNSEAAEIFGFQDKFLHQIEKGLGVRILARGGEISVSGEENAVAAAK